MFDILYKYFIQQGAVSLPGIGSFVLGNSVGMTDFVNKQLLPPGHSISFNTISDTPHRTLFGYIASQKGISEWEAIKALNDFAYQLRNDLRSGKTILWRRMGNLSADLSGEILFDPLPAAGVLQPVKAERVIRSHAQHNIRVGDAEKTNYEMSELLGSDQAAHAWWKSWWVVAAALALLGITTIIIYLTAGGKSI
jgi:hypothetical protein